ncbi:MAG TPA: hypothetical protein VMT03_16895 [Polyangia bacterium]|nr:hypothetical protein [Polyangia bacterium]
MNRLALITAAILGLALGLACSSSSPTNEGGTGGSNGSGGSTGSGGAGGCKYLHYFSAGCDAQPTCFNGTGGSCFSLACGCNGKVIVGCDSEFGEPYAYQIEVNGVDASDPSALTCDPAADAGH